MVTAAELLSVAAFREGRHAQAFPSFGSERTGAPVVSFCRIADVPIRVREPVVAPDALIVQDVTLLRLPVLTGLVPRGYLLLNTSRTPAALGLAGAQAALPPGHLVCVPATELALEHVGRAVPNVPLLGAFAALTGLISLESVCAAIDERFGGRVGQGNAAAARAAYTLVADAHPGGASRTAGPAAHEEAQHAAAG